MIPISEHELKSLVFGVVGSDIEEIVENSVFILSDVNYAPVSTLYLPFLATQLLYQKHYKVIQIIYMSVLENYCLHYTYMVGRHHSITKLNDLIFVS